MWSLPEHLALGALFFCLTGCGADVGGSLGSSAGSAGHASGGSGAASGGDGSASIAPSGGGGSGGQQAGGSSTDGVVDCASFKDAGSWQLLVEITNEMSQTLHLGQQESSCDAQLLFQVEDGARTPLPGLPSCRSSCQAAMAGTPEGCPLLCASPATVTLEPGQSIKLPWDGRFAVERTLPQQCLSTPSAAPTGCISAGRVEAGLFTFSARAGTLRRCLDPSGACSCAASSEGGCATPASLIGGTIITTEVFMMLEPGEAAPGGEPPYIGLVFRDQAK